MKLHRTLAVASIVVLPTAAIAQPIEGLYVAGAAGYNSLARQNIDSFAVIGQPAPLPGSLNLGSNGGWVIPVSVGYGLGNGLRLELQSDYRHTEQHIGGTGATGSGANQTLGIFVNALYDFDVGLRWVFPYLGAGVGYTWTSLTSFSGSIPAVGPFSLSNSTQSSGAGQAIVGLAFPIPDVPRLSATAEFRYMATFGQETFNGATLTGIKTRVQYQANFSGLLGLRYALYAQLPPPPALLAPVAAPTPAPSRTYLVFFDWDKADLTDRARQIIGEAARNSPRVQLTRIEVNGYTDTSGSPDYNRKLSLRRAQSVAAELVKDGVLENEIMVQGFGETHLQVPTGSGVREPQNRRVEIVLK